MNSTLKSFIVRTISAIVALTIVCTVYFKFETKGLIGLIIVAVFVANYEFVKIIFKDQKSITYKTFFYILSTGLFLSNLFLPLNIAFLLFPVLAVVSIIWSLLCLHKNTSLNDILSLIMKSVLGLFYMGLLPSTVLWIAIHSVEVQWFIFLLAVVFSGDTLAYLSGVLFGTTKIMPSVSPKKSLQGAIGGLFGSAIAGAIFWKFGTTQELSVLVFVLVALFAGLCGQFGDFFESLLKRLADVKDSGKIMPGHGGILDRIDAVLFASPVILLAIYLIDLF